MPRVLLWNYHTPYVTLFARALADWSILVVPTPGHAPTGWRHDHRPQPPNVTVLPAFDDGIRVEAVVAQTWHDWEAIDGRLGQVPVLHLAHNRAEFDAPSLPSWLSGAGVRLVAISAMKAASWVNQGYAGVPVVIPPGIPLEDYPADGWTGEEARVLTVANTIARPLFDVATWLKATRGLPITLVGEGNEGLRGAIGPAREWDQLRQLYRSHRVYLSVNRLPYEDGYNLALLEAMASGMPCVCLSSPTAPSGVIEGQDEMALREWLLRLLREPATAGEYGSLSRSTVARQFSFGRFAEAWRTVLEEVAAS